MTSSLHIAFVMYNDFRANSAIQVHHFANHLTALGCRCDILVPKNLDTCRTHIGGEICYTPWLYSDYLQDCPENAPPDIIHAWTPREVVRRQVEKMRRRWPSARLVIDLEDNEELVTSAQLGLSIQQLRAMSLPELDDLIPESLSHPLRSSELMETAAGFTIIMDTLESFLPPCKPRHVLWPVCNRTHFFPRGKDENLMGRLGLTSEEFILCYIGNVHAANWREVRSLYIAVALARRQGIPAVLLRAGRDFHPFLHDDGDWVRACVVPLGMVSNREIPELLALADLLVQPGRPDPFNDYRLPSKLPEFLAMAKPVVLPRTNLGRFVQSGKEAFVTERGDALEILGHIKAARERPDLYAAVGRAGALFVQENFEGQSIARKLLAFYISLLSNG